MLKNNHSNIKGSTLLIVVILMSIVFFMSSMMFGYALRTYHHMQDVEKYIQSSLVAEAGLNDSVISVCSKIDLDEEIGLYQLINTAAFMGDARYQYQVDIAEEGFYDASDYSVLGNVKSYRIKRGIVVSEEDELISLIIAIKSTGRYEDEQSIEKALLSINSNEDGYFEVSIYTCQ